MRLELISMALCPYVQRSVITLAFKKVPYEKIEIDLGNPPDWFLKISPLGQVPVLRVDGTETLFESTVINEYIDEVTEPRLMPSTPLARARERAWIEYGSSLLADLFQATFEKDRARLQEARRELMEGVGRLESALTHPGPFFRGMDFSLVDTAYAPFFMRLDLFAAFRDDPAWKTMPKVREWANALARVPAVQSSVPADFGGKYVSLCRERGSLLS